MIFRQLFDRKSCTYTYLLADEDTGQAVLIDPVIEMVDRDLALIEELCLSLEYILETHVHADHVTGAAVLQRFTGAKNGLSKAACATCADLNLEPGDLITFGQHTLHVLGTPGHTEGCISYLMVDQTPHLIFTGDAIFVRGCGRTDFQGGSARTLFQSVHREILSLPPSTIIYPGHDYRGHQSSSVGEELAHNPRLNEWVLEDDFVEMMAQLNLSDPKMMDVAVPANTACGVTDQWPAEFVRKSMQIVEPTTLESLTAYTVVDVREADEFEGPLGHLPNAQLVPLAGLRSEMNRWDTATKLLMVCRSGARSAQACKVLLDAGFSDVSNLGGGMIAWRESGVE